MSTSHEPAPHPSPVAERLLAHARLCEHIAQACWNEETAAKLKRMARECTQAAQQMAPAGAAAAHKEQPSPGPKVPLNS